MSINRVCISGNLTKDPELRQLPSGTSVLQMRLAVNDRRKNSQTGEWEDAPNYVDVLMWGQRGESLSRFLSKGSKIMVDGKLRWHEWEDKNSGDKRSKLEVVADDIEFASGRGESGGGSYDGPASKSPAVDSPAVDVTDDDIPF